MKAMHKVIVMSAAYRQASKAPAELLKRDPFNRLLARGPRFRMDAEMVRDNALAVSGLLNRKIGGPSVFPYQPDGVWFNPYSGDKWVTEHQRRPAPARAVHLRPADGPLRGVHGLRRPEPRDLHGAAAAHQHAAPGAGGAQ